MRNLEVLALLLTMTVASYSGGCGARTGLRELDEETPRRDADVAYYADVADVDLIDIDEADASDGDAGPAPSWVMILGENRYNAFYSFAMATDGTIVATGHDWGDIWGFLVVASDRDGELLWQRQFEVVPWHSDGREITACSDGTVLVASSLGLSPTPGNHLWLAKIDTRGELLWQRGFAGARGYGFVPIETTDGDIVVSGTLSVVDRRDKLLVVRLRPDGQPRWAYAYEGEQIHRSYANRTIAEGSDGRLYIVATEEIPGSYMNEILVFAINADGGLLWQRVFGLGESTMPSNIIAGDGRVAITGLTTIEPHDLCDMWLMELSESSGEILWQRSYQQSGTMCNGTRSSARTEDGELLVIGSVETEVDEESLHRDLWIAAIGADGRTSWQNRFDETSLLSGASDVIVGEDGLYLVGTVPTVGVDSFERYGMLARLTSTGEFHGRCDLDVLSADLQSSVTDARVREANIVPEDIDLEVQDTHYPYLPLDLTHELVCPK